jgi:hypothetical protein
VLVSSAGRGVRGSGSKRMTSGSRCVSCLSVDLRGLEGLYWWIGSLILGVIIFEHRTADGPRVEGKKFGGR